MKRKPTYEELKQRIQILEEAMHYQNVILDLIPYQLLIHDSEKRILWAEKASCDALVAENFKWRTVKFLRQIVSQII